MLSKRTVVVVLFVGFCVVLVMVESKSGPYRSLIVRTEECATPSRPYEQPRTVAFHAYLYNSTRRQNLLRGNATILRENKNMQLKIRGFVKEGGKWIVTYVFNQGCKGIMVTIITKAMHVKYNKRNCSVAVGTYLFDSLDFNELDHKWAHEREYGSLLWIAEAYTKAGTSACWETETSVEPL